MRIVHINNTANAAWRLAEAQRRLGHEVTVVSLGDPPHGFPSDRVIRCDFPFGEKIQMFSRWRFWAGFDVVHVHGGIWRTMWFYPVFKRRYPRKTLVVHLHGSETRSGKGLHHLRHADSVFIATPDLARWVPQATWVPNPIDLPPLPPPREAPIPRFGHFPSKPSMKGTETIVGLFREAFGSATKEGDGRLVRLVAPQAELLVVTDSPHEDVLRIMEGCDVVIDQCSPFGAYGYVAIEAMAMGKPVLSSVNPEFYPGCPIIPLDRDPINNMRRVAFDKGYRRAKGVEGWEYVARVHDAGKVARQVLGTHYEVQRERSIGHREAVAYWKARGRSYASEVRGRRARTLEAQAVELSSILAHLDFETMGEVGCGFGRMGRPRGWVGVDLSRDQLLQASRNGLRGSLVQASGQSLPLRDAAFDLVLAVEVLMHIPPDRILSALQEMARVARRYMVHLDWYEDYLHQHGTGWCWVHDYPGLWRSLGLTPKEYRLQSTGIQSVFVLQK